MAKLFLEDYPTYTGRPVDAESLMRDWDKERRDRIKSRWDTVKRAGGTALAITAIAAGSVGLLKIGEGALANTNNFNRASAGDAPELVQGQIDRNEAYSQAQQAASEVSQSNP